MGKNIENQIEGVVWLLYKMPAQPAVDYCISSCLRGSRRMKKNWGRQGGGMEPLPYSKSSNGWDCSIWGEKAGERIDQGLQNHKRYKVVFNQIPRYENEEAAHEKQCEIVFETCKEKAFLQSRL